MPLKSLLLLSAITLTSLSTSMASAKASSFCDRIADPVQRYYCQGRESTRIQQSRDRAYSDRQQYLAQAVSQLVMNYYQRTGQLLPVTEQTIEEVIQVIGASRSEAAFVVDRLMANTRAITVQ